MSSHHFRDYRIGYGRKRIRSVLAPPAAVRPCEPCADGLAITEPAQSTTQLDALAGVRAAAARSRNRFNRRFA